MTSAARPFNFDTVFDGAGEVAYAPPRPKRMFTPDEVEQIRAAAYAEGERSAVARSEAAAADALADIAVAARAALSALAGVAHEHRTGSAELALAAARTIASAALERFPEAPVRSALEALAREIEAEPRLVVRVDAALAERLQATLDDTAQAIGFRGQISARAEPGLAPAAFVLEWGDGRASFDPVDAARRVEEAVAAALAADGLHAEPLIPASEGSAP